MIDLMKYYLDIWSAERDMYGEQLRVAGNAPISARFQAAYTTLVDAIAWMVDLKEKLEDGQLTPKQIQIVMYDQAVAYMAAKATQIRELKDQLVTLKNL
jgi:hypothetical protein